MTLRSRRSHKEDEPVSAPLLPRPPPLLVDEEELKDILRYTVKVSWSCMCDFIKKQEKTKSPEAVFFFFFVKDQMKANSLNIIL